MKEKGIREKQQIYVLHMPFEREENNKYKTNHLNTIFIFICQLFSAVFFRTIKLRTSRILAKSNFYLKIYKYIKNKMRGQHSTTNLYCICMYLYVCLKIKMLSIRFFFSFRSSFGYFVYCLCYTYNNIELFHNSLF